MVKTLFKTSNTEKKTRKFVSMPGRKMFTALTEKNGKRYILSRERFFNAGEFANELRDNGFRVLEIREGMLKADAFGTKAETWFDWFSEEEALWGDENLDINKLVEFYGGMEAFVNQVFWGIKEIK